MMDNQPYRNLTTATDLTHKKPTISESSADRRKRQRTMSPEQIIRETPIEQLKIWAHRGAPMAITELERRSRPVGRKLIDMILPHPPLDIGV